MYNIYMEACMYNVRYLLAIERKVNEWIELYLLRGFLRGKLIKRLNE